ncbi:MAG TPA: class I SAM-dependent rRNA methyltransferase [Polyangiaceae bacterium]
MGPGRRPPRQRTDDKPPHAPATRQAVKGSHNPARYDGAQLILPNFLEAALEAQHPWIYRDHVPRDLSLPSGTWLRIRAGKALGWALWDAQSTLALRCFSVERQPDAAWVHSRVKEALALRRLWLTPQTNAYRLLYGEGDGIPGITVDVYGDYAVVISYAESLDALVPWVKEALVAELAPKGILDRRSTREAGASLDVLAGNRPPKDSVILENGLRYYADLESGQKSGLFLDQRDNRQTLARFVGQGSLLNLFCYTGGFSVVAAKRGAAQVTSVDRAEPAVTRARDNFDLNGLDANQHEFVVADCYEYLAQAIERQQLFDVVMCDPPSLARNRSQLDAAIRAYTLLNARGMRCTRPGGFYGAASCTAQVSPEAFRQLLGEAARRAGCRLQIVHEAGHALDHPHFAAHPEGRYLKFIVGRVLERC